MVIGTFFSQNRQIFVIDLNDRFLSYYIDNALQEFQCVFAYLL